MGDFQAFGIGCFHFGYRKPLPYRFIAASYVRDVKEALGALPSVSDVEVELPEEYAYEVNVDGEAPSINDGGFFPQIAFLRIDFTIFIPRRVIREMFPHEQWDEHVGAERFRVQLRHEFHSPIAIVECLDPAGNCSPSGAVRLLREFLGREIAKLKGAVTFECLGPSPFHGDFYIRMGGADDDVAMKEVGSQGYGRFVFTCGSDIPQMHRVEAAYHEVRRELDLYYELQQRYVRRLDAGSDLIEAWRSARSLAEEKPSMWNLRRRLRLHRAARDLAMEGYTLEAQADVDNKDVERLLRELYSKEDPRYLERYLKNHTMPAYPIASIIKWAERIEDGSFKQAEIQAVIVSALAGGVVGSLLTRLLT